MGGQPDIDGGQTVTSRFLQTVAAHGDLIALRAKGADGSWRDWTYRRYADDVARVAGGLQALGVRPADRVVLMMRNVPEFHVTDLAVLFCGATAVSIGHASSADEAAYLVEHCAATVAIVEDGPGADRLRTVRHRLPALAEIVVLSDIAAWQTDPVDLRIAARTCAADSAATIVYTSDPIGAPKAVPLTHGNVVWTADAVQQRLALALAGLRIISYEPMSEISARLVSHYLGALFGLEVTSCADPSTLGAHMREIRPNLLFGTEIWDKLQRGIEAALGTDPVRLRRFNAAVRSAASDGKVHEQAERAFASVRESFGLDQLLAAAGAAPLPDELLAWHRTIGVPLSQSYGMAETTGFMAWDPVHVRAGTVGRVLPGSELFVAADGEVRGRGGNVFTGYLDDPDSTAERLESDGTFHSGDVGVLDDEGYLWIVDSSTSCASRPAEVFPDSPALQIQKRGERLRHRLATEISRRGPVPFSTLMEIALYDPRDGFFAGSGGRAGRRADFLTSPEVGPLFGAVVARALDTWWDAAGRPTPWTVIEVGAGPGALARDVLAAGPACLPALRYVLVERSATQRAMHAGALPLHDHPERALLATNLPGPVVVSVGDVPRLGGSCVVLANELLDNLPLDLALRRDDGWCEVRIALDRSGAVVEHHVPLDPPRAELLDQLVPEPVPGARVPLQGAAAEWVRDAIHLAGPQGRLVLFDYAATTAEMAAQSQADWLRTYRHQRPAGSPLENLGSQDITSDVATDQLAMVRTPDQDRTQADWLRAHGLDDLVVESQRLWAERDPARHIAALRARRRIREAAALTDPFQLGAFRVLEWAGQRAAVSRS